MSLLLLLFFFFNDTATTEIYTLSLHDALPISPAPSSRAGTPLLVIVHGGPAGFFSNNFSVRRGVYPVQLFAQGGFTVLMPNPRGSGGYGETCRPGESRGWGGCGSEGILVGGCARGAFRPPRRSRAA